jgi:hypothetical protein
MRATRSRGTADDKRLCDAEHLFELGVQVVGKRRSRGALEVSVQNTWFRFGLDAAEYAFRLAYLATRVLNTKGAPISEEAVLRRNVVAKIKDQPPSTTVANDRQRKLDDNVAGRKRPGRTKVRRAAKGATPMRAMAAMSRARPKAIRRSPRKKK